MTSRAIAWLKSLARYLRLRSRLEDEVDEEFRAHIEMRAEDLVRAGLSPAQARRRAGAEFGGVEKYKEEGRRARGEVFRWVMLLDTVGNDVTYACRGLLKAKGASTIAVLTIGLGIGITTVMFSIVHGFVDVELPFEDADRLVLAGYSSPQSAQLLPPEVRDYVAWHERQRSFEVLAAYRPEFMNLRSAEHSIRYSGGLVTVNMLELLSVQPILGRGFTQDDGHPGAPLTVLIGRRVWEEQFAADPGVLGRSVTVNGEDARVIGVMGDRFSLTYPMPQEFWVPLRLDPFAAQSSSGEWLIAAGKLAEGVTVRQASQDLSSIAAAAATGRSDDTGTTAIARPFAADVAAGETAKVLYAFLASAVMVLLIACGNVANLLLARAAIRSRDVALRTALGASRVRAMSQIMAEAALLAAAGSLVGTVIASIGIDIMRRALETLTIAWMVVELDLQVFAFVAGSMVLAALAIGLIPAWRGTATDVGSVLKDGSGASPGLRIGRLSRGLIVAQVAMSVALLAASGFMVKALVAVARRDFPVPAENVFVASVAVHDQQFPDVAARRSFWDDVERNVSAIPGVRSMAFASALPGIEAGSIRFTTEGSSYPTESDVPRARRSTVSTGFFSVFGAAPIQGRVFDRRDASDATQVVVINQSFARRFLDGQPIGRRIRVGGLESDSPWREIIGVVPDLYMAGLSNTLPASQAGFYTPLTQEDVSELSLAALPAGPPLEIMDAVRTAVSSANPDTPMFGSSTLLFLVHDANRVNRIFGALLMLFGVAALFMASAGLYGVMSFTVTRRIPELGIRAALGASANQVRGLVVLQGMRLVIIGLASGSGLAVLVVRGLGPAIPGATLWDTSTYALVFTVLTLTGLLATALPARRATRVDPMKTLRAS